MRKSLEHLKERIQIAGDDTPLNLNEAGVLTGKSRSWFYRAEKAGKIRLCRIGARGTRTTYGQVRSLAEPRVSNEGGGS